MTRIAFDMAIADGGALDAAALEAKGDAAVRQGSAELAERAYLASAIAAGRDRVLVQAAIELDRNNLPAAEQALRATLRQRPTSIAAIRLMAMLALKLGRQDDSLRLLDRALQLAPGYAPARELRARTLQRMNRFEPAMADVRRLVADDPDNPSLAMLNAALMVRLGWQEEAAAVYAVTLAKHAENAKAWMSYGHVLKALGRTDEAVIAYHRALDLEPGFGEVWWSLANLKTFVFADSDLAAMRSEVESASDEFDRLHLHFALGKALEDRGEDVAAFAHYALGNGLRRAQLDYRANEVTARVDDWCTALASRRTGLEDGSGWAEDGAIFIVGLPRSGSTLVEQILASHPAIEGTAELPEMMMIADRLADRAEAEGIGVPTLLAALTPDDKATLGREYYDLTHSYRREGRALFIDKMPNNWLNVAIIAAILPRARIIDVRRQPMAVGWAAYKQHFAKGQEFTYDLGDLGRYYSDYVRLMAAVDEAMPGRVHRVSYEMLVDDTDREVRALLAHLALPFDDACLTFWKNRRTVRTPSAEQVRQPVFRDGLDQWRRFASWLDPLRAALGPLAGKYETDQPSAS
ncbi:MAG: sulfotransferase [Sphingomonadales bacterium]|nr:sulfotransferase [Sphingomonadales bacterium]